ncbi:MAG: methyltransferase domain-containing protein [Chloroflexi bacterium]|nr:methyltransferase domain-containing protein [Chloroflexota bacterium]
MEAEQYEQMFAVEDSHWWYRGMWAAALALLQRTLNGRPIRILDAGCGTGGTTARLGQLGGVVGLDTSPLALERSRARGIDWLVGGSVEHLPFAAGSFDVVTTFDVLYHRQVGDDLAALREFARILRPGGVLLVRVPAHDWLRGKHDAAVHTAHRYGRAELREKLATTGFRVERLTYANCLLFPLALLKRLLEQGDRDVRGDLAPPTWPVNAGFAAVLQAEAVLLRRTDLPWGLSLFALARRSS